MKKARIVIVEDGLAPGRDIVITEQEPPRMLEPVFAGTGPARGEFEDSQAAVPEYLPPSRQRTLPMWRRAA